MALIQFNVRITQSKEHPGSVKLQIQPSIGATRLSQEVPEWRKLIPEEITVSEGLVAQKFLEWTNLKKFKKISPLFNWLRIEPDKPLLKSDPLKMPPLTRQSNGLQ